MATPRQRWLRARGYDQPERQTEARRIAGTLISELGWCDSWQRLWRRLQVLEPDPFVDLPLEGDGSPDLGRFSGYWRRAEPLVSAGFSRSGWGSAVASPAPPPPWDR